MVERLTVMVAGLRLTNANPVICTYVTGVAVAQSFTPKFSWCRNIYKMNLPPIVGREEVEWQATFLPFMESSRISPIDAVGETPRPALREEPFSLNMFGPKLYRSSFIFIKLYAAEMCPMLWPCLLGGGKGCSWPPGFPTWLQCIERGWGARSSEPKALA